MANHIYNARNVNDALVQLAGTVMDHGDEIGSRLGERTMELTQVAIRLERPWEREILLPGRKANLAAQIIETMWVLSGRNDVATLLPYLPRAADFSDDGETWTGAYGPRLRAWRKRADANPPVDQLAEIVKLLKSDRSSRRAVMSIFDPGIDHQGGKDVPCNNWVSFISRLGELEMHVAIRSNDLWWGWSGINAFEWSALQEIVAGLLGVAVGPLHFSTTSLHLYDRHWKRARELATAGQPEVPRAVVTPRFQPAERTLEWFDAVMASWWEIEDMIRNDYLVAAGRRIDTFPEPMLQSWLYVIAYWWTGSEAWLTPLAGSAIATAATLSPKRKQDTVEVELEATWGQFGLFELEKDWWEEPFVRFAADLHREKNEVYGDSWRRRGEMLAILANIARKVDRLGVAGGGDTASDTVVDLLVYLVKYELWLREAPNAHGLLSDSPENVHKRLAELEQQMNGNAFIPEAVTQALKDRFEDLTQLAHNRAPAAERINLICSMQASAYRLAKRLWGMEQHPSSEGAKIDAYEAARRIQETHSERNATRVWNPEASYEEHLGGQEPDDEPMGEVPELPADRDGLVSLLAAVGVQVTVMDTINWSQEQQERAGRWAVNEHLSLANRTDLLKPEFLP